MCGSDLGKLRGGSTRLPRVCHWLCWMPAHSVYCKQIDGGGGGGTEDVHGRIVASRYFQYLKRVESTAHKLKGTYDKVNGLDLGLGWLFSLRLLAKKPHLDPGPFHLLPTFLPCSVFTGLFMVA